MGSNVQLFAWLCLGVPLEVPKQWHQPPLHRIPSRPLVPELSPYKYLDSERETDAGEDPTQGVSEYFSSKTLVTLVNTCYDTT